MDTALGTGGQRVSMFTLDSMGLPPIAFIKLDVQGSELAVLQGAKQLVARDKPALFIEIEERQLRGQNVSVEHLMQYLFNAGYVLLWLNNAYPVDFVALPKERLAEGEVLRSTCPFETEMLAEFSADFLVKFRLAFSEKTKIYK